MVITGLWGTAYSFMAFFPCFPPSAYWDLSFDKEGLCYGYGALTPDEFYATYSSASYSNMFLDIIILAIPIHLYFKPGTDTRSKLGLLGVLTMGGLTNGLAIWRVATIVEHKAATYPTLDPTWYGPISILLASCEVDLATICASVPVFWPVLTSSLDRIFITREIKIERNHRFSSIDENHRSSSLERIHRFYSLGDSEAGRPPSVLTEWGAFCAEHRREFLELKEVKANYKNEHYKDSYVIAQVDPLSDEGKVESSVVAERPKKRHPNWI
ncbi:hypothetical protein PFICI_07046 [Pestalotiopsis fici W106-1]|uniref:Rhodopsin domain-containing protein n=1 Tax=Pestalotiopsis fici (strain W106-1 / CGMCC3.15140) TaxID=1229662 RepID=W3X7P1_PESFW|nr:uncharacterized protein PFICI_07046 [Pestalotiopsis fici W106-1]ETS82044.1 hypothetical protein PFICI_07046 [Pestalotiopsis fici W106-1]